MIIHKHRFVGGFLFGLSLFSSANAQDSTLNPSNTEQYNRVFAPRADAPVFDKKNLDPARGGNFAAFLKGSQGKGLLNIDSCISPIVFRRVERRLGRDLPCEAQNTLERLIMWNHIALDTTSIDHTPEPATPPTSDGIRSFKQVGPHRSSRAMAIVHIAMFDTINAVVQRDLPNGPSVKFYNSFSRNLPSPGQNTNIDVAIIHAAYETLIYLYPDQKTQLTRFLRADLCRITKKAEFPATCNDKPSDSTSRSDDDTAMENVANADKDFDAGLPADKASLYTDARSLGRAAAREIINVRMRDRADHQEPEYRDLGLPSGLQPGLWSPDPVSGITVALGAYWNRVTPFTLVKAEQFRPPPPPPLGDPIYLRDFNEVKRLGGDRQYTRTERSDDETFKGIFWAYDGTAFLCAPPRLYNQIIRTLVLDADVRDAIKAATGAGAADIAADPNAEKKAMKRVLDVARILALSNTAMADAAISAWEAKYYYKLWRPVTGIRGAGSDGSSETIPDFQWRPLGAPASNAARGPNLTPPFPSYPSGHAVFGGAVFEMMRKFFLEGTAFTFISDEYNGFNAPAGNSTVRPLLPQSFLSLSAAEQDNGRSRVYLGVHWQFDSDAGIAQGNQIANHVYASAFQCLNLSGVPTACNPDSGLAPATELLMKPAKQ